MGSEKRTEVQIDTLSPFPGFENLTSALHNNGIEDQNATSEKILPRCEYLG